ncbi:MAG: hypothetical protein JWP85_2309 [Rhodoglobus sp.]|nr:hypothetical protein [Rhodoglobus sp.]
MPSIREPRRGGRLLRALTLAGAALWLAAPLALVVVLTVQSRTVELTPARPVWATVEANAGQVTEPIDVVLEWQAVSPVVAPAWSGTVQSVGVTAGSTLSSGQPVAVIDGVTRVGYHSQQPFYRPLTQGDGGQDAAALNTLLAQAGFDSGEGDRVTRSTLAGVRSFAAVLGVPNADELAAFDPSWLVYLPAPVVDVSTVNLVVGAPAPPAGTVIAELDDRLAAARLAASGGDDETERPALAAGEGQQLTVAGVELPLADDRENVADLVALRQLVADEAATVSGQLSRPAGDREWVVPAAAVVAGADGVTCVVSGTPDRLHSVGVVVVGGQLGRAIVTGDLTAGDRVSVKPAAELRRCE